MKPIDADRFWAKVDKSGECWLWTACTTHDGYGRFVFNGRVRLAHRLVYEWVIGDVPPGMHLHHVCQTPACVNPDHLQPITSREHMRIGDTLVTRNLSKTHCPQGHPYDEPSTYRDRVRYCRACKTARSRAARAAARGR